MYAKDITTGVIESHMKELYDMDISDSTISPDYRQNSPHHKGGRNAHWERFMRSYL